MSHIAKASTLVSIIDAALMLLSGDSFGFYLVACPHMGLAGQPMQKDMDSLSLAGANIFRNDVSLSRAEHGIIQSRKKNDKR